MSDQRYLRQPERFQLSLKDAIVLAYSNPSFMESLIADPASWAAQFNLPPEAVQVLRTLDPNEVRKMGASVRDPISFAESAELMTQTTRATAAAAGRAAYAQ
jgi:hypothetical protein